MHRKETHAVSCLGGSFKHLKTINCQLFMCGIIFPVLHSTLFLMGDISQCGIKAPI